LQRDQAEGAYFDPGVQENIMNHRLPVLVAVATLLTTGFLTTLPASAAQAHTVAIPPLPTCDVDPNGENPVTLTFFFPPNTTITTTIPESALDRLTGETPCSNGSLPSFTDGRCNQDPDQTVAVYSDDTGGYNFYAVNGGNGTFAMHVTEAQLDASPAKAQNYVITQNLGVKLYRLTDGSLLVTGVKPDGKSYSFYIGSCGAMEDGD
jgi:hypothetical protein